MPGCLDNEGFTEGSKIYTTGVETAMEIRQAGAIAVAIANATQLIKNAKRSFDISSKALKLSEEMQDRQEKVFWPKEIEFLKEFGTPEEVEEAEAYGRRFAGKLVSSVAAAFAKQFKKAKCNASRYCTSDFMRQMQALQLAKAQAIASARMYGRQMGFSYRMARIDRNDQRRLQAIAMSKDLFQSAANLYKNATSIYAGSVADATNDLNNALSAMSEEYRRQVSIESAPLYRPPEEYAHMKYPYETNNSANPANVVTENVGKNSAFSFSDPFLNNVANDILGNNLLSGGSGISGISQLEQAGDGLRVNSGIQTTSLNPVPDTALTSIDNSQTVGNVSLTKTGTVTHTGTTNVVDGRGPHQHTVTVDVDLGKHKQYAWTDHLNSPTWPDA